MSEIKKIKKIKSYCFINLGLGLEEAWKNKTDLAENYDDMLHANLQRTGNDGWSFLR